MKKTRRTLLTAAAFAATLNMASVPNINAVTEDEILPIGVQTPFDPASQEIQDVYGPAPDYSDTTTSFTMSTTITEETTTTVVTLYGPPWVMPGYTGTTPEDIITSTTTDFPPTVYGPPEMFYKKGDLNGDHSVDVFDIIALRKRIIQSAIYSAGYNEFLDRAADVNDDGEISIADLVAMSNFVTGRTDTFFNPDWNINQPMYGPPMTDFPIFSETTSYDVTNTTTESTKKPRKTTTTTTTTTTTSPFATLTSFDPSTMPTQTMYGPPPTTFDTRTWFELTTTTTSLDPGDMPIQLMYGPPEYFLDTTKPKE